MVNLSTETSPEGRSDALFTAASDAADLLRRLSDELEEMSRSLRHTGPTPSTCTHCHLERLSQEAYATSVVLGGLSCT